MLAHPKTHYISSVLYQLWGNSCIPVTYLGIAFMIAINTNIKSSFMNPKDLTIYAQINYTTELY